MDNTKLIAEGKRHLAGDGESTSIVRRLTAALEAAETELKDLRDEVEEDGKVMRSLRRHREEAEAELTRRDTVIANAPHSLMCRVPTRECNCWKSAAPVSLEAAKAETTDEPVHPITATVENVNAAFAHTEAQIASLAPHDHEFEDRCYCGVTAADYFAEGDNRG